MADLSPRSGSEQRGRRPVVILSNDGFNLTPTWLSLIVVPISSSGNQARRTKTAVLLPAGTASLSTDSAALCHQITTLDRRKVLEFMGALPAPFVTAIEEGVKAALDFPLSPRGQP